MAVGSCCCNNPILDRLAFYFCILLTIALLCSAVLLLVNVAEGDALEREKSFDYLGSCVLVDIYFNSSCNDLPKDCYNLYQYEWQVFDLNKCERNLPANYTFFQYSNINLHYQLTDVSQCYTDDKCTDVLLTKTEYDANETGTFIAAFILFIVGLCFVMFLWSWASTKHRNDRKYKNGYSIANTSTTNIKIDTV